MESLFKDSKYNIAVAKIGGYGDSLQALFLARAIKRKYPDSKITLYIRDSFPFLHRDINLDRIVVTGACNWNRLVEREAKKFDIFFDDRYIVGEWQQGKIINLTQFEQIIYWDFFKYLNSFKENLLKMSAEYAKVKIQEEDLNLRKLIVSDKLSRIIGSTYIVIHSGRPDVQATKLYPRTHWNNLIRKLKKESRLRFFQVGTEKDIEIQEAIDLRGKMKIEESFELVAGSKFIICEEGLFAHVARGMNVPAVVLFGSTSLVNFGYSENINIEGKLDCGGCWYKTPDWYKKCPERDNEYCCNLASIKPAYIISKIHARHLV